jgi:hypothetical protein
MVFSAGSVLTASALNDATLSGVTTYTPVIANGGTVTWTTRTGWYYKFGTSHLVFFCFQLVVNATGSGATAITVTAPTSIDRTTKQQVGVQWEGGGHGGIYQLVGFTAGSGTIWDRLYDNTASAVTGATLTNGSAITAQGFYREA